jgi:prolyl-tRNA editing enzyme YbaK/EbsC (Cys-tRNA(Pro) deacylase)
MMPPKLAKSAASVQEALDKLGLECKVLELPNSTRTALDAASSIRCDIAQIVKSLIFKTKKTGRPVLILASGHNQVDIKTIEDCIGESITKADAVFVRNITGFAIGGIPPLGHKNAIDFIYIDQDLMALDEVWAAAGTPNAVFCIKSQDLLKATDGKLINIKEIK